MRNLLIAVIVAALLYSGFWFFAANRGNAQVDGWIADLEAQGWQVSLSDRTNRGFPNRIDTTFDDLRLQSPSGHVIEAPFLQVLRLAYRPSEVIVIAPPEFEVRINDRPWQVEAEGLRASINVADGGWPDPVTVEMGEGLLTNPDGVAFSWGSGLAASRVNGAEEQLYLGLMDTAQSLNRLGPLRLDLNLVETAPTWVGQGSLTGFGYDEVPIRIANGYLQIGSDRPLALPSFP